MHKKLESELISIAHAILQMKNKKDVIALKNKAKDVYERLALLEFVDRYVAESPSNTETKEAILSKMGNLDPIIVEETIADLTTEVPPKVDNKEILEVEKNVAPILVEESIKDLTTDRTPKVEKTDDLDSDKKNAPILVEETISDLTTEVPVPEKKEIPVPNLFSQKEDLQVKKAKKTLEEELKDTIPVDVATHIFENAVRLQPKKSLNDTLVRANIQIGLNDRIAFVKNLFEGSQEDFNRVVSQLNSFKEEKEALKFIQKMVKPDYDWAEKEEYEERFVALIQRKFA
ncbi:hypothetical protein [Flavicella sediminum]|uniref:hypothetical protein n=1 Tax=Flavicella sediminum TaxID=2585141 RepID=UPI001121061E|nr:hypothetical protein [Flavicella sediminum]